MHGVRKQDIFDYVDKRGVDKPPKPKRCSQENPGHFGFYRGSCGGLAIPPCWKDAEGFKSCC